MTSPRRQLRWFDTLVGFTNLASGVQTNHDLLANQATDLVMGSTITRIILKLALKANTLVTLHEMHYGISIVNADAVIGGALPDADVVSDRADWMLRGWLYARSSNLSDRSQDDVVQHDVRAQRILRASADRLHIILDASASGVTLQYAMYARVLVRLR